MFGFNKEKKNIFKLKPLFICFVQIINLCFNVPVSEIGFDHATKYNKRNYNNI